MKFLACVLFALAAWAQPVATYTPAFQPGVTILNSLNGQAIGTNPQYCLTAASAVQLAQLPPLAPYVAGYGYADPFQLSAAGPFTTSQLCPYFVYLNGAAENAAFVAQIFTHGYPWATELTQATAEITGAMQAYAAGTLATTQVSGLQAIPPATPPPVVTPAPPAAPADPVGVALPDGRYQDLSGNAIAIGASSTDARGIFTKQGTATLFGTVYWWTLNPPTK